MADFIIAVSKTLDYEGGLVELPDDPGGLTNFGISLNNHPELTEDDIRTMTKTRAIGIYRQQYWADLYEQIQNQAIANSLFDFGVTSRPSRAVAYLQGILGSAVVADGNFGSMTLQAVNSAAPKRTLIEFTVARLRFYAAIGKPQFLHSWFQRTIDALL